MSVRSRKQRRVPPRDVVPPEVPEVVVETGEADPEVKTEAEPIPEHIRRMLEAAYT